MFNEYTAELLDLVSDVPEVEALCILFSNWFIRSCSNFNFLAASSILRNGSYCAKFLFNLYEYYVMNSKSSSKKDKVCFPDLPY